MSFVYTKHATMRIKQRDLSIAQVEQAVLQSDRVVPSFGDRMLAQKDFSGKILEVVYRQEKETIIILTAYWLEEAPSEHQL